MDKKSILRSFFMFGRNILSAFPGKFSFINGRRFRIIHVNFTNFSAEAFVFF